MIKRIRVDGMSYENRMIAEICNPKEEGTELWEFCGDSAIRIKEIEITPIQRKEFVVHCALAICNESSHVAWALKWLKGDRDKEELKKVFISAPCRQFGDRIATYALKIMLEKEGGIRIQRRVKTILEQILKIKPDFDYVPILQKILERDKKGSE